MIKRKENVESHLSGNLLAKWIIGKAEKSEAYRAGTLTGMKHPKPDREMIKAAGGLPELIRQADELEKSGYIRTEKSNLGADMKKIYYSIDVIPKLCEKEGIEDPRKQQLRYIKQIEQLRAEVQGSFLEGYYDEIIRRLELGEIVKSPDMEDVDFFRCLNAVVNLKKSLWMRVFSAAVLNDSKRFKKDYEKKVVKVLVRSPLYEEGMTDDEILSVHGILSYAQVMEWKGPLLYKLKGGQEYIEDKAREKEYEIDTSQNQYGTVINSQTLERAFPVSIKGVQRIVTIENKANYEEMKYREDTLYLFCHGFYSPKERIFLKRLMEVAEGEIQYFHWGDMDMGGIRIFRFNKKNIFPKLKPYKMDREAFQEALERGAGIPLEEKKKEKLEKLNAGELEELKKCILEKGVEIEQEILLAENAIAEN